MSIRTTVTLDEDVVERVQHEARTRGDSFRNTLNDLLRLGLLSATVVPSRRALRIKPVHMGVRPSLNYDDIGGLLDYAEGDLRR